MNNIRILFVTKYCPICLEVELATQMINMNLPFGQRIQIINIFSNDPRLSYIANLYKTWDKYQWNLPVLVLDKIVLKKRFNTIYKSFSRLQIAYNIRSLNHYNTLIEEYLNPNTLGILNRR